MILTEENNQGKILMDRVLDVHHEQENMPSANGKLDRLSGQPWEQPQQQHQQAGLAAQSLEEEWHQVLHQPLVSQEGKGLA